MSESVLDRVSGGSGNEVDVYDEKGPYKAFGVSRRSFGGEPLIDFVSRGGNHHALTYSHFYDVTFNPSMGIVLQFTDHLVTLEGRGLKECYGQLLRQRVVWIAEANNTAGRRAESEQTVIVTMTITPKREQLQS